MAIRVVEHTGSIGRRVTSAKEPLIGIMAPNTLIAVFPDYRAAESAAAGLQAAAGAIRLIQGAGAAAQMQREWRERPIYRRLIGFSDEGRIVERLARYLEGGATVLAYKGDLDRAETRLGTAEHVIRLGRWLFREVA